MPTLYEKLNTRLQNHRAVAVMILIGSIVIGISAFTDAAKNLTGLFAKPDAEQARLKLAQLSVPYSADEFVERAGIPIAIFAVTDAASDGRTYWWDRVDNLFPRIASDRWRAFEDACGVCEEYRTGQPREYGPLRPLRQWILATYAGRWPPHLEHELERLEREAGYRTHQRAMTFEELNRFAAMPGVEIGVHTVSHPVLPLLSDSEIEQEIVAAHHTLREHVANTIPVLALPFGLYDERTLRLAASAGMSACLTLSGETLGSSALPSGVPRICITKTDARAKLSLRLLGVPRLVRAICGRRLEPFPALPSATT